MNATFKTTRRAAANFSLLLLLPLTAFNTLQAADPRPASPPPAPTAPAAPAPPPQVDPATGLPNPPAAPDWKAPNWKDPDKVIPDLYFDGLPLQEIARFLGDQFKGAFDIIIPPDWHDSGGARAIDPGSFTVKLRLKNVTASEVFNAMNILFESQNAPYRWELLVNGTRPLAVLRILPNLLPPPPDMTESAQQQHKRMVYFVGDLLGDEKNGGMTMEQLVQTLSQVFESSFGSQRTKSLQFHKDAQLLVINGTVDQISFMQQTLNALRQKAELDRHRKASPNPAVATDKKETAK